MKKALFCLLILACLISFPSATSVYAQGLPDLVPTSVSICWKVAPSNPSLAWIYYTASEKNIGTLKAGVHQSNGDTRLKAVCGDGAVGDGRLAYTTVPALNPGQTVSIFQNFPVGSFPLSCAKQGGLKGSVIVDSYNSIMNESNESNNIILIDAVPACRPIVAPKPIGCSPIPISGRTVMANKVCLW